VTEPADGDYFARSREACGINVVATQSYARLVAKFKSEHAARSLMANLCDWVSCARAPAAAGETTAEQGGSRRPRSRSWPLFLKTLSRVRLTT